MCSWALGALAYDSVGRGASVGVVGEEVSAGSRSRPRLYSDRDPRPLTSPHNPSSSPDPSGKVLLPEFKPPAQVQSGSRDPLHTVKTDEAFIEPS